MKPKTIECLSKVAPEIEFALSRLGYLVACEWYAFSRITTIQFENSARKLHI